MKLSRVDFDHVQGVPSGLVIDGLSPGLNVVLGDNGAGKSTLVTVVRGSLWPRKSSRTIEARSHWQLDAGAVQRARVRGASVSWTREPEGALCTLPAKHLSSCYVLSIRDLLGASNPSDQELAKRIRMAMRGGFDLDGVRQAFPVSDARARKARGALRNASAELGKLRREFRQLGDDQDQLASLGRRTREAREAEARLPLLDTAAALLQDRQSLAQLEAEFSLVPEAVASLGGREANDVGELQRRLSSANTQLAELRQALQAAREGVASAALGEGGVDEVPLRAHRASAQQLATAAVALDELRGRHAQACGELDARSEALGTTAGEPVSEATASAADLDTLDGFLMRRLKHEEQVAAAQAALDQIDEPAAAPDQQQLAAAIHALRSWLRSPGSGAQPGTPAWITALAAVAIASGLLLAALTSPWLVALAGLGAGLLLARTVGPRSAAAGAEADAARRSYGGTAQPEPAHWNIEAVSERLSELEQALAAAQRSVRDTDKRNALALRLQALEESGRELETEAEQIRARTGLGMDTSSLALVETARRLAAHGDAAAESEALGRQVAEAQSRLSAEQLKINTFLESYGVSTDPAGSVSLLQEQLEDLRVRSDRRNASEHEVQGLVPRVAAVETEIAGLQAQLEEVFARLGLDPGDTDGLDQLLDRLAGYQALLDGQQTLSAVIESREKDLHSEPDWLALDDSGLAELRTDLLTLVAGFKDLNEQTQRIHNELQRARSGTRLEEATAAHIQAQDTLYQLHEEALLGQAAQFLIGQVEEDFQESSRPEVLSRAMEHFSSFTRMTYKLEIGGGDQARLLARDTSTLQRFELSQLSDGTRIQLLLAVRLAFASSHEQGTPLPLFLDEALSTSDPGRFAAVATAILDLVEAGKQVFYLTANPADISAWHRVCAERQMSAPRIVELGTIRQEHTALRDPELLASPRRSVPEPGDLSVAEYGDLLAPPQPDRFAPVESLDLFYPAMDRLTLVHRLRCSDIKTTGQWLQVETAAAVGRYVEGAEERRALSARVHMARQYLERWRIGRGRPMTAADLEASGLVSETFIAPMAECLRSHQGQAQALLDAIDDKSIKRFRSSNRDELEDYLLGEGFLDPRDALSSLELEAELLADLEPEIEAGTLQASVLRAFVSMMDRTCHTA